MSDCKEVEPPPTAPEECSIPVSIFQIEALGSTSEPYVRAFKKLDFPTSVYDGRGSDKPPPSGLEECSIPMSIFQKTKIRPLKMGDPVPLMGKYVALAVCRQRLHDEVLGECKTFVLADALHSSSAVRSALGNHESDAPLDASNHRENLNNVCGNLLFSSSHFFLVSLLFDNLHILSSVLFSFICSNVSVFFKLIMQTL